VLLLLLQMQDGRALAALLDDTGFRHSSAQHLRTIHLKDEGVVLS
jgi:hypothetical protein